MNLAFVACAALVLLGAVPEPLLVGVVRDQQGAPIVGALVVAEGGAAQARARTDADGTFVLRVDGATQVRITCAYCVPTTVLASADGTAVAIVRRYDAIERTVPSARDIAQLPYVHIESDLSLAPYAVLDSAPAPFPGPTVNDRGLESGGGSLVDNGVPNYDPVANASPFSTVPAGYIASVSERPASSGYAYGDVAGGGTYAIDPFGDASYARAYVGSGDAFRASTLSSNQAYALGYSGNGSQQRERADASIFENTARGTLEAGATASAGTNPLFGYAGSAERSSFSAAQAEYHGVTNVELDAAASVDRGTYAIASSMHPYSAAWSDASIETEVRGRAQVSPFVLFGERYSSGYDWQQDLAANALVRITNTKMVAGVQSDTAAFKIVAAAGRYDISYAGGTAGYARSFNAALPVSLVSIATRQGRWFVAASGSTDFRLPTAVEAFDDQAPGYLDPLRSQTYEMDAGYTDAYRFRVGFTAAARRESGFESGVRTSMGANVAWQVAPFLTLRSWVLHIDPQITLAPQARPYITIPRTVGVGSAWLTYERPGGLRMDAIWRRDLQAWVPHSHLDASIAAPISHGISLWGGTSVRYRRRYVFVGLRV